jgi:hypothetical protein
MSDQQPRRPDRKITIEEILSAYKIGDFSGSPSYLLDIIARLQDLGPKQQLKAGDRLNQEDVGRIIEINGLSGPITDIRPWNRGDSRGTPTLVAGGRMYEIDLREFYVLTSPDV